ncbi:MAG: phage tail protein, partial [Saprospiraceae bacterium]
LNSELIGSVAMFAMNTPPTGWFKCNGAAISRATYAALFAKVGTTFGAGNGSTTFNLPDLRGEFVRGWDDGRGLDPGRVFGSAQAQSMEAHNHPLYMQTNGGINNNGSSPYATTLANNNDSSTTSTLTQAGGSGETRPRNIAMLYAIKWQ